MRTIKTNIYLTVKKKSRFEKSFIMVLITFLVFLLLICKKKKDLSN